MSFMTKDVLGYLASIKAEAEAILYTAQKIEGATDWYQIDDSHDSDLQEALDKAMTHLLGAGDGLDDAEYFIERSVGIQS